MVKLNVKLFGKLAVHASTGEPISLTSLRAQELFGYLLLSWQRATPREALLDLFWKESSPAQARRNLRQALWQLQSALVCRDDAASPPLLSGSGPWIQINPAREVQTDVMAFEQAFADVRHVPGEALDAAAAHQLEAAAALYRGDLLEGWYQEWCLVERERLQTMYLAMLDKLMAFSEAHRCYESGLSYGEQALRYVRSNERTHRRIMRLLFLGGERAAALQQYLRCRAILRDELDVEPSPATTLLYERIRGGQLDGPLEAGLLGHGPAPEQRSAESTLAEVYESLKQLCTAVTAIQKQLRIHLRTVENAILEQQS